MQDKYQSGSFLTVSNPTLDKCQKILRMFQQIDSSNMDSFKHETNPKKYNENRMNSSLYKTKPSNSYYIPQSSAKKSNYNSSTVKPSKQVNITNIYQSNSKSISKNNTNSSFFNSQNQQKSASKINNYTNNYSKSNNRERQSSLIKREKSNSSFVSCYNKESRLDKIMKLKVSKPSITSAVGLKSHKKTMILNTSFSSLNSSRSSLNKENINLNNKNRHKQSRLQKIMNIKVQKPKVNSTLLGYEPRKMQRSSSKSLNKKQSSKNICSVIELKDCKKKQRKSEQIQQKQQRLWKLFQRERQQQLKEKKKQQEQYYKQQRRQEEKFQKLVQKELKKIQNSRQISLRKDKAFSDYVYPAY